MYVRAVCFREPPKLSCRNWKGMNNRGSMGNRGGAGSLRHGQSKRCGVAKARTIAKAWERSWESWAEALRASMIIDSICVWHDSLRRCSPYYLVRGIGCTRKKFPKIVLAFVRRSCKIPSCRLRGETQPRNHVGVVERQTR